MPPPLHPARTFLNQICPTNGSREWLDYPNSCRSLSALGFRFAPKLAVYCPVATAGLLLDVD
jgi:hypothetical protein